MEERQALSAFAALSQETRLRIVRLLVQAGPAGMPAGAVAEAAGVSASNVSFHLKELTQAGLASAKREARSIVYTADYDALSGLIQFLMRDCCAGHPDICMPATASACTSDSKELSRA
ncbi:ArsR/SmtB family transcription factor [Tardiphaga sp. 1201_B9_N1_1]|jgi:DNA-binding transcriptional ArsR family regulator|uniref:Helix-turn-helix transcriptional regulator n=1 Tax=Tardiphaga robiniae TaxID=943830 RepID=A0A7G6U621_9BRAD|nr:MULTISPECIES: metalloregulator ArsR/SmtB family transcription factor [Tardiphaga]NUU43829.1 helix-turn-helix transcriptional regulator [Tardiphaga robiniae]QND74453.1 helix-turn-helix transcriptional regulator [Tardiphaga robiniae]SEI17813.1 transcriptional regulator, ArsR family [Tardiphaga sp. OK245]SNS45057.1 transcriptional regulator, ArsR family [Tardiphaga sp. OK246]